MMAGRQTKYTPERVQRLLSAIRAGNTRRAACAYAGISDETLARWQRAHVDFVDALTRAEAESEVQLVDQVRQADDWHAKAWILERRWPDAWGKRDKVEITIRQHAEKLAAQLGLTVDEIMAEVDQILASSSST